MLEAHLVFTISAWALFLQTVIKAAMIAPLGKAPAPGLVSRFADSINHFIHFFD